MKSWNSRLGERIFLLKDLQEILKECEGLGGSGGHGSGASLCSLRAAARTGSPDPKSRVFSLVPRLTGSLWGRHAPRPPLAAGSPGFPFRRPVAPTLPFLSPPRLWEPYVNRKLPCSCKLCFSLTI